MGITLDINCQACGWNQGFRLGTGSGMARLRDALDLAPEEHRIRISEITTHYPDLAEDFELCLLRCPSCGRLFERLRVSLLFNGNQRWEAEHCCDGCGSPLESVADPDDVQYLPCPGCGKQALVVAEARFWD
ncbi:MAG: hypothetical protein AB7E32_00075 [Desulfovibrio sp.]